MPRGPTRLRPLLALAAVALVAGPVAARTPSRAPPAKAAARSARTPPTKAAAKSARTPHREPPPPDPLAGAWPSRDAPQLGDGTLRSEVLVAARRLAGLSGPFDADAFVRHLAYVLDLARKDDLPADAWARTLVRRAAAHGLLHRDTRARPGDLVVFSLDASRPRSDRASRLLVGVVESVQKGTVRFLAPLSGSVARGVARPGRKPDRDDTALLECRAPDPPPPPPPKKGRHRGRAKAPKAPKPLPCRAGELWIGRVPPEALERVF